MFVPFESLPGLSRIWIYQADKKLSSVQKNIISNTLQSFTRQWMVHGTPMDASFDIRFDQFVIIAANDQASGCSIDASVRVMKNLGETSGIDFFNRNLVAFKHDNEVKLTAISSLKKAFEQKMWQRETLTFNNLVSIKHELDTHWIVPAETTWLKRYITGFSQPEEEAKKILR